MDETTYKYLIFNSPFGYAYHRILFDSEGLPCDFEFIEVNKAFEMLSNLQNTDLVGKKASEVSLGFKTSNNDLVTLYGGIALQGGTCEFEEYSTSLDKWYKVTAYSLTATYFITVFLDITVEKRRLSELDSFFSVSLQLLCIADTTGRFLKMNKEWEHVLGFTVEELEHKNLLDLVHSDDLQATISAMASLDRQEPVRNFVNRFLSKDGTYRYLEWRSQPQGQLIFAAARDITENLQMERSLKQESALLLNLLDSIPDLVFFKNVEGRYLGCNNEFSRYSGVSRDALIGHTDEDLFPEHMARAYRENDLRVLAEDQPRDTEEWIRYPDGSDQLMETKKAPLKDSSGNVIGLLGITRNIMARKVAETRLLEQENNFHTFFDSLEDMAFVGTPEGRIIFANRSVSEKLGYGTDELLALNFLDVHPSGLRAEAASKFRQIQAGEENTCSLPLETKSGVQIAVQTRAWKGRWNGGDCIFGVSKDLSTLQTALEKFQSLFDFNPALLTVLEKGEGGYVVQDINQAFIDKTGFSKGEIIGRNLAVTGLVKTNDMLHTMFAEVELNGSVKNIDITLSGKNGSLLTGVLSGNMIKKGARSLVLTAISDISAQKEAEDTLRRIVAMETHIAETSTRFINLNASEIDRTISKSLGEIGSLLNVDRVYIFLFNVDQGTCSNTHEWCSAGTGAQIDQLQDIPETELPWWMERMRCNENIILSHLEDLPPEACSEKAILESQHIKSLLVVPMVWSGHLEGFMGFDSVSKAKKWISEDIAPLELLSSIITGALKRKESEQELQKMQDSLRELNVSLERRVEERTGKLRVSLASLKKAQQTIIQQEKLASLGQLAAGVAHEINNPTGYIMCNLNTLSDYFSVMARIVEKYDEAITSMQESVPPAAEQSFKEIEEYKLLEDYAFIMKDGFDLLKESIDGANRIKGIVVGLQSSARADNDRIEKISVDDLMEKALKVAWNELKYKSEVIKNYGNTPGIALKENQILQVFLNLLINAGQAITEKGCIQISTKVEGGMVLIQIRDNGSGIQARDIARIFDPFYSTKGVGKGTGLGLSISLGIVTAHGGTIDVESKAGTGTVFNVRLPMVER